MEGTLAKEILKEPEEVTTMSGQRLPMKCSVEYISFSAHTDFEQTSHFIRTIRPPNVVSFPLPFVTRYCIFQKTVNSLTENMYLQRHYYCIVCAVSNIAIAVSNVTSYDEVMNMDEVALQIQITF